MRKNNTLKTHLILALSIVLVTSCLNSAGGRRGSSNSTDDGSPDTSNSNGPTNPLDFYSITRGSVNESASPANIKIFFEQNILNGK